ncbi:tRNA (adenosine(37)-N6)-threonylcarbamoyltransferase complex ATPase subunit type 1 TsaE [Citreimonas salinaria]|uniref:tRNA threonylcarbamoyladenosine biosynthesis protein TsaE n=1 Tax=Citreimonas salinaria TaxID=321339 RepID=A0A1H3FAH0_9RHOB|nr:tRNA (adenosine(37)-N6)-threonylcarbamoyltransferase complex ATPase subunit type 1 TsaE [Citreimonas salinaria]SDX87827.1 tRNA threonylcarbamoyladenosine biosynthesis protein TsaE [Citreimonas salinaria]
MTTRLLDFVLGSEEATAQLARSLAPSLHPGDVLLLSGGIGAGKTHFARSLIQTLLNVPEDVPSPTFTLVQEYDTTAGPLWHADLYRLSGPDEIEELGLVEAFDTAICLVEWPDRLGALTPSGALHMDFAADPDDDRRRALHVAWTDARWAARLASVDA